MLRLIGTSHVDFHGYERLTRAFNRFQPETAVIEDTSEGFTESTMLVKTLSDPAKLEVAVSNALQKFPDANPETLRLWLGSVEYDTKAVNDYAQRTGAKIILADSSQVLATVDFEGQAKTKNSPLVVETNAMLKLTPEEHLADVRREYAISTYPVADNSSLVRFYSDRDSHTEQILREQKGNVVYVAGLDHLFGDYKPNLTDRLSDLNPDVLKLNAFDK